MRRFVFLDRDGTINHDPGYVYALLAGVVDALAALREVGFASPSSPTKAASAGGFYTLQDVWRELGADLAASTGHGEEERLRLGPGAGHPVVDDLRAAARYVLSGEDSR